MSLSLQLMLIAWLLGVTLLLAQVIDGFADRRCRDRAERAGNHTLCAGITQADDFFGDTCRCEAER